MQAVQKEEFGSSRERAATEGPRLSSNNSSVMGGLGFMRGVGNLKKKSAQKGARNSIDRLLCKPAGKRKTLKNDV